MDEPISPKRDAFIRLAEKRTTAILERIRVLGNLRTIQSGQTCSAVTGPLPQNTQVLAMCG